MQLCGGEAPVIRSGREHGTTLVRSMDTRERLSIGLWLAALAIWLIAGLAGSLSWWVVAIIAVVFGANLVRAIFVVRHH